MFLKHTLLSRNVYTSLCWMLHTEHENSCAETLKGSKAKYEGTAAIYISQQIYPKCQNVAREWVTPLTPGDFWSIEALI